LTPQSSSLDLGTHIATFRGRPIDGPTWIFVFLPGALVITVFFLYGVILAVMTYQQHGPALAIARSQAWILFAAILFLLLAAYLVYRILISLQRIRVFESGLQRRSFFLQVRIYMWAELSGISSSATRLTILGKPISTTPAGKIFISTGRSIDLSGSYQGIPKLIKIVKSKLYPLIWPQIKSEIRSGRAVNFGHITVRKEGMEVSKRTLPWESISRLHTEAGFLVVELHDNSSRKVPTINIPNLELLLETVNWGYR
jgi:hypothetical protein